MFNVAIVSILIAIYVIKPSLGIGPGIVPMFVKIPLSLIDENTIVFEELKSPDVTGRTLVSIGN